MSPEQARGLDVNHQTDIFSFGAMLYELLSGVSPFAGDTVTDMLIAVVTREPSPLRDMPPKLADAVGNALQKERSRRYQTATELLRDLKEAKQDLDTHHLLNRPSSATTAGHRHVTSVAVLPFVNMSAAEDTEHFCDGLAEELLNALSKVDRLKVAGGRRRFHSRERTLTSAPSRERWCERHR
jgi:serine/threonine-protein kinase